MFREWRVCLVCLVLWCGSRDVVSGGDGEKVREKYLKVITEGENGNNGSPCREAPEGFYELLVELAGKSAAELEKEFGENESGGVSFGDVKYKLNNFDSIHSKGKRCVTMERLVCSGGKCVKCDKDDVNPNCGQVKTIVDKEGSLESSKESEGGRVKTPVGVVVVSVVIGFMFAL